MTIHILNTLMLCCSALFPMALFIIGVAGEFKPQVKGMVLIAAVTWLVTGAYAFGFNEFNEFEKALWIVSTVPWAIQRECRETTLGIIFLPFYMVTWMYLKTRDLLLIEDQQDDISALKEHWLSWVQ